MKGVTKESSCGWVCTDFDLVELASSLVYNCRNAHDFCVEEAAADECWLCVKSISCCHSFHGSRTIVFVGEVWDLGILSRGIISMLQGMIDIAILDLLEILRSKLILILFKFVSLHHTCTDVGLHTCLQVTLNFKFYVLIIYSDITGHTMFIFACSLVGLWRLYRITEYY